MKRILITGANGFIGKNLLSYLKNKYTVLAPSHKELDLLDEQATYDYFASHPVDIVIHCAVVGGSRNEEYVKGMFYDNVRIFFNIVRCKKYFKRMINIGSGAEYDKRYPIVDVKEDAIDKRIPSDEYGLYKYVCANYINKTDTIVDLRVFGMFGEGEDYRYRFISNAICRKLFNKPITLGQDVVFDYMDIKDFQKIVAYFVVNKPKFHCYNIGSSKKINLTMIASKIHLISGEKGETLVKKPGLNNEYTCNCQRLYREMKSFKPTDFDVSIVRLYEWYKSNKASLDESSL